MDVIAAYRDVGTYRGAAEICGTTHKTVKRIIAAHEAVSRGEAPAPRVARGKDYQSVAELVADKVVKTAGKISAKRLLPAAANWTDPGLEPQGLAQTRQGWDHDGCDAGWLVPIPRFR